MSTTADSKDYTWAVNFANKCLSNAPVKLKQNERFQALVHRFLLQLPSVGDRDAFAYAMKSWKWWKAEIKGEKKSPKTLNESLEAFSRARRHVLIGEDMNGLDNLDAVDAVFTWLFLNFWLCKNRLKYASSVEKLVAAHFNLQLYAADDLKTNVGYEKCTPDAYGWEGGNLIICEVKSSQYALYKPDALKRQLTTYERAFSGSNVRLVVRWSQRYVPGTSQDFMKFLSTGVIPRFEMAEEIEGYSRKKNVVIEGGTYLVFENSRVE